MAQKELIKYNENGLKIGDNLEVDGNFTANSVIENMSGYSFVSQTTDKGLLEYVYCGVVKNGNKLTLINSFMFTKNENTTGSMAISRVIIPNEIVAKIIPAFGTEIGVLQAQKVLAIAEDSTNPIEIISNFTKYDPQSIYCSLRDVGPLVAGKKYYIRQEATFLLTNNLAI